MTTPTEVWLRVCGGGTSLPSGKTYTTMVGDDREQDRHTRYIRADHVDALARAVELTEKAEDIHANCEECEGLGEAEECERCFPSADEARIARRTTLAAFKGEG